jgi:preprotein translocase subunit SecE
MKINWKIMKVVLVFVVIAGVVFWAVDSVRSRSYSGSDLSFDTSGGLNIVTNPSDESVAALLTSDGFRTFRVTSNIEGIDTSSTRTGTGSTRINQLAFELPPGTSEFTVSGGTDVSFVAATATELQATVNPMSSESRRNVFIATAVVVFGALFYASHVFNHRWLNMLRPGTIAPADTSPAATVSARESQGKAARTYGDNRADTGDESRPDY